jgi:hypothetical protein
MLRETIIALAATILSAPLAIGATPSSAPKISSTKPVLVEERHEGGEHRERCEQLATELRRDQEAERKDQHEGERREAKEETERMEKLRHEFHELRCEER